MFLFFNKVKDGSSMFLKKTTQAASQLIGQNNLKLDETQKLLQQQLKELQNFTSKEIPQMKETQKELVASLEQLAQSAKALIKK